MTSWRDFVFPAGFVLGGAMTWILAGQLGGCSWIWAIALILCLLAAGLAYLVNA